MSKYYLGIDTSCYTTSIAIVDQNKKLIFDGREVLKVAKGSRGLRQSEAVFQHMKNLPIIIEEMCNKIDVSKIAKVCVSNKPRNLLESYMPVFTAGVSFGKTISTILGARYEEYSHQEGHIEAAKWSTNIFDKDRFIAVHISGGTTELLEIIKLKDRYKIQIIGGTKDISAGQLIDRIGVMMGIDFPSGKKLEEISNNGNQGKIKLPVCTTDTYINFSGTETYVKKLIENSDYNDADVALALFECIYKSLYNVLYNAYKKTKMKDILLVGGVASNRFIRDNLYKDFSSKGISVYCGEPRYCTDNAVGIALLGLWQGGEQ